MDIVSVAIGIVVLNLPFGYWRANEKKFSRGWFLSVHAPVPFVIALRILSGLGWQFITFPILIGAFFGGQWMGGKLHLILKDRFGVQVSSCLVLDLVGRGQKPQ